MIIDAALSIRRSLCLCLLGIVLTDDVDSLAASSKSDSVGDQRMSEGNAFMSQGDFGRASEALRKAAALYESSGQRHGGWKRCCAWAPLASDSGITNWL